MTKENAKFIELTKQYLEIEIELSNRIIKHIEKTDDLISFFESEENEKLSDKLDEINKERDKIVNKLLVEKAMKDLFDDVTKTIFKKTEEDDTDEVQ